MRSDLPTSRMLRPSPTETRVGPWSTPLGKRFFQGTLPYLLLAPALAVLGVVILYPLAYGLWLSLHRKNLLSLEARFVGLDNFEQLLADEVFLSSIGRSLQWTALGVAGVVLFGLALALLLNSPHVRGKSVLRSLILFPWLTPTVVVATIWVWLLNPQYGYLNHALRQIGVIETPINFLATPGLNLYAVLVPLVWRGYPFVMLVLLAALQSIDETLYEAAAIDGAGAWQRFRHVTLPSLAPPLASMVLIQAIWIFNHFDIPFQMTAGGPAHSSELLSTYAFNTVFGGHEQGYGAAIAALMLASLVVMVGLYVRFVVRAVEELDG